MSPPAAEQLIPERRRVVSVALCDVRQRRDEEMKEEEVMSPLRRITL